MRYALVNPHWTFEGSIYFGCREPHLPLEYSYAQQLLERAHHEVLPLDAHQERLSPAALHARLHAFAPDLTIITTAPTYLFWRCPPPELRVPMETARLLKDIGGLLVAVGPHPSATPRTALRKLGVDAVVIGECEEVLPHLAHRAAWPDLPGLAYRDGAEICVQGPPATANLAKLAALRWPELTVRAHTHHHHRFDAPAQARAPRSRPLRGCPYHCTFCAKDYARGPYRKRPLATVLEEIDALISQGVEYLYFVDEIFLPDRDLLHALSPAPGEIRCANPSRSLVPRPVRTPRPRWLRLHRSRRGEPYGRGTQSAE